MHSLIKPLIFLCLANAVFSVNGNVAVQLEGDVVFTPVTEMRSPSSILWRLGKNKVADLDKDFSPDINYYGDFRGRTTLNATTGELKITKLKKTDEGLYSVEFNSKALEKTFTLSIFRPVPKPSIGVLCLDDQTSCRLSCDGDTAGAEPVTYWWKAGEGGFEKSDMVLNVFKGESQFNQRKYICKLKNAFGEKDSDPVELFVTESSSWAIVGAVISLVLVILAGLIGFLVWKKRTDYKDNTIVEFLQKALRCFTGETGNQQAPSSELGGKSMAEEGSNCADPLVSTKTESPLESVDKDNDGKGKM